MDVTWADPDGDHTLSYGIVTYPPKDRNREDKACRYGPRTMIGDDTLNATDLDSAIEQLACGKRSS